MRASRTTSTPRHFLLDYLYTAAPGAERFPLCLCVCFAAEQEIQERCFKLGIPLKTRHREVAPNQYEFAPMFGPACQQIDQNLLVMQVVEETAAKYGLAALLQEKPFQARPPRKGNPSNGG